MHTDNELLLLRTILSQFSGVVLNFYKLEVSERKQVPTYPHYYYLSWILAFVLLILIEK